MQSPGGELQIEQGSLDNARGCKQELQMLQTEMSNAMSAMNGGTTGIDVPDS